MYWLWRQGIFRSCQWTGGSEISYDSKYPDALGDTDSCGVPDRTVDWRNLYHGLLSHQFLLWHGGNADFLLDTAMETNS